MVAVITLPLNALRGAPKGQSESDERRPRFGSHFNVGALEGAQDTGLLTTPARLQIHERQTMGGRRNRAAGAGAPRIMECPEKRPGFGSRFLSRRPGRGARHRTVDHPCPTANSRTTNYGWTS